MSLSRLLGAATLLALATSASATSFVVTTDAVVGAVGATMDATSDVTSSLRDDKLVLAARDDAASFVASSGNIRGVQLEAAFSTLRERLPEARDASDEALAQAILAL